MAGTSLGIPPKTDAVRAGLTALPNAAADAAGGLAISDAGGLDLDGLAMTGADSDTLETLSDQMDDLAALLGGIGAGITRIDGVNCI